MSSNRKRADIRMSSITRKLHWSEARGRFFGIIFTFLFSLVLIFAALDIYLELTTFGHISLHYSRNFEWEKESFKLYYCIVDPETEESADAVSNEMAKPEIVTDQKDDTGAGSVTGSLLEVWISGQDSVRAEVFPIGLVVLVPLVLIFILRLLNILLGWHDKNKKIRQILRPINELALKADELSRISFSEDKYQMLEEAITHIDPEKMQTLSLGDSDLAGVETAMNNLLTRMKESYAQQARFVNDASHELRTPIAIIEGYANMLDRWGTEDEKVLHESITAIRNESAHMKRLVEQLLFLARGDSGRTILQKEEVSLCDMMQEIYEESLLIDEEHSYHYSRPEEDIVVSADAGLLKQAVRILVDNAAKYTNKGDEILLSVGGDPSSSYLQVEDTGIGMAEADVKHMFDRFYRSDEVRKYKGTGLGLAISKWIIDKHKGHFEILSRQGIGTRIRIILEK